MTPVPCARTTSRSAAAVKAMALVEIASSLPTAFAPVSVTAPAPVTPPSKPRITSVPAVMVDPAVWVMAPSAWSWSVPAAPRSTAAANTISFFA